MPSREKILVPTLENCVLALLRYGFTELDSAAR